MKVLVAGDFVPNNRIAIKIEKRDYRFLDEIKPIIQSVDYAIVNFESPVVARHSKAIDKTGPCLCCTENAIECVSQVGFGCVTLANNHFRDFGQIGVEDTISACNKYNIDFVGGGKNIQEASRILYKEIKGRVLAIINVCEHEWSIASEDHGGSNPLDIISICRNIKEARNKADYVMIIIHGGTEHYNLPTPRMKHTYRFFIDNGADAVVNHHQHCYSGFEIYQKKPIVYGLGNFCFDKDKGKDAKLWEEGYLVEIDFDNTTHIVLYPYKQCSKTCSSVKLVEESNLIKFNESINQLNYIILDDKLLHQQYEKNTHKGSLMSKSILAPYSTNFFLKLSNKGILPSFSSTIRRKRLLAYIQCESHRDILISWLNKDLKK